MPPPTSTSTEPLGRSSHENPIHTVNISGRLGRRRASPAQSIRTSENLFLNLVLARAHHSMPEPPGPALVPREFEPGEQPQLRAERDVER